MAFEEFTKDELIRLIKHVLTSTHYENTQISISQNTRVRLNKFKGSLRFDEAINKLLDKGE